MLKRDWDPRLRTCKMDFKGSKKRGKSWIIVNGDNILLYIFKEGLLHSLCRTPQIKNDKDPQNVDETYKPSRSVIAIS